MTRSLASRFVDGVRSSDRQARQETIGTASGAAATDRLLIGLREGMAEERLLIRTHLALRADESSRMVNEFARAFLGKCTPTCRPFLFNIFVWLSLKRAPFATS